MPNNAEPQREMLSLVTARVRDAYVRKPFYVDGTLDLVSVCRELSAQSQTTALVRDGERLGIFTTTDLRAALLRPEPPAADSLRRRQPSQLAAGTNPAGRHGRASQHRQQRL